MHESQESPLARSPSPFLRHGAAQPVRWLAWGEAAFERARREDRPVLLDIGAVWCHWCHVMDRESYDDPEIAAIINDHYVPVKVDRDERPDVDMRYQRALQVLAGQGGWPLTGFLTPDGDLFFGGTYFPPEDRQGRPSFRRVLLELARLWRVDRQRTLGSVREVRDLLARVAVAEAEQGEVEPGLAERIMLGYSASFDGRYGGFGRSPKFPPYAGVMLHLDRWLDGGAARLKGVVTATLDGMARGGIHDHLGGGFHRYATDARWLVPHFEKMAYDNGLLLEAYACAHSAIGKELYRVVAEGILRHYRDISPELLVAGGFPSSQDADASPGDDGDYWTWTVQEVRDALDGDERLVKAAVLHFGLEESASRMPSDPARRVLFRSLEADGVARKLELPLAETRRLLDDVRRRLRQAREERPAPFVDRTLYTGWVAMVAAGHLAAARYLGLDGAREAALRALDRIWADAFVAGAGIAHRAGSAAPAGPAEPSSGAASGSAAAAGETRTAADEQAESLFLLEDQAYVANAWLAAFELTQQAEHLARAAALAEVMLDRFVDPASGAFSDRPTDEPAGAGVLAEPLLTIGDSPMPAGNAVAAQVLFRLAEYRDEPRYRQAAKRVLAAFAGAAERLGTAGGSYARAVDWTGGPITHVVVVAEPGDADGEALFRSALWVYRPRLLLRRLDAGGPVPDGVPPVMKAMLTGEAPRAYVCTGESCLPPVSGPEEVERLLRSLRG